MNTIMLIIFGLIVIAVLGGMLAAGHWLFSLRRMRQSPLLANAGRGTLAGRLLAVPLIAWSILFLLLLVVLLLISGIALLYVFALLHGEWFALLENLPKTAGNVLVHLIYPIQLLLFAFLTFYLAVGGFQLVFGALPALRRLALFVEDIADFARRLAGLLAVVVGLEVVKILLFSLLVQPEDLSLFFARDAAPKADPLGAALLAAALLAAVAAWWRRGRPN